MHPKPIFSKDLVSNLEKVIAISSASRCVLICDENTKKYCWPIIKKIKVQHFITFIAGENIKNWDHIDKIISSLLEINADRKTLIIALGGGTILDLAGFAASIYKRGIKYINIPTTLLAMVDAAIGGKTAINFMHNKNVVGSFYPPIGVYSDAIFLKTLPETEIISAKGEIIKHSIIAGQFINLEDLNIDNKSIYQWAMIKYSIVKNDPLENNNRLMLNAGHSIGHALESHFLAIGKPILHGLCVAAGLWMESYISKEYFKKSFAFELIEKIIPAYFPKLMLSNLTIVDIETFLYQDKKNSNNEINIIVFSGAHQFVLKPISIDMIANAIAAYQKC